MRKTIILYNSKTGYTKKYAEWIAWELAAEISDQKNFNSERYKEFDNIIFGGSLYATGISGIKKFMKSLEGMESKKIMVFATGLSIKSEEVRTEVMKANFKTPEEKLIEFFYFRGGFDFSKLPATDKFLMKMKKISIERKAKKGTELTSDEKGMLAVYDHAVDYTSQRYIRGLVEYVHSLESNQESVD